MVRYAGEMRICSRFCLLSLALILTASPAHSEESVEWSPDQEETFLFPDAPPSLWQEALQIEKPTAITVQLPTDYSPDRKFPLVLLMGGAQGSHGHDATWVRKFVGDTGIITVSMPFFLRELDPLNEDESNKWRRLYIAPEESTHIWKGWQPMLEKVFATVPNIDRTRCFIGGFSNGGNATAVVLNDPETRDGLREYFNHFLFIEGGRPIDPWPGLEGSTFLICEGELKSGRFEPVKASLEDQPGVRVDFHVMPETGHAVPDHEKRWIGNWIRRECNLEPLPEVEVEEAQRKAGARDDYEGN